MKKIQLFLLQGLLSSVPLYTLTAQTTTPSTHYAVETGIVAGHGDYSPFWFTANRQGLSSVKTENGYLRAGIFHSQALGRHFTWKAGLDLATAYNYTSSFVVQQAYADLSYRWLNLSIGSKERTPELRNPKLSTGGLVESNSARPYRRYVSKYLNTYLFPERIIGCTSKVILPTELSQTTTGKKTLPAPEIYTPRMCFIIANLSL